MKDVVNRQMLEIEAGQAHGLAVQVVRPNVDLDFLKAEVVHQPH